MNRVFVIGNCKFPRGSALANYLQYLMLALQECGYKTILISDINREFIKNEKSKQTYGSFTISPVQISKNKLIKRFQYRNGFSRERIGTLKHEGVNTDDIVILLTHDGAFCEKILTLQKKRGFKIIGGILEMFGKEDYSGTDEQYQRYMFALDKLLPQFDLILPISTYIENYYKKKGCRTFCLPIMADCLEYSLRPKENDKYRFVLPANGKMKDDLSSMLKGFSLLTSDELAKIEIHICGVKEEDVKKALTEEAYRKLGAALIIHKWMKYEELVDLYQRMHFLILARETSQMTKANFPSKVPETMGFGIVPICSEVGDYTKYYLKDGVDSIFMHGSSPEICCEAIKKAIAMTWDEYKILSHNARKTVETRFDYRIWAPKIKEALESI